ncbi:MAG: ATP-binding protein [Candidatus Coproplasma sp.]
MEAIGDIFKKNKNIFNVEDFGGLADDEYIKDDIIYCKKCNTPRMFVSEYFKVRCLCKCQSAERDKANEAEKERERIKYIEKLQTASLIGERYKNVSFANTETGHNTDFDTAFIRCKRYCEVYDKVLQDGLGIYIYGAKGTGKTHLTACMANDLMHKYKQVLFTNFFEISKMIRGTFGKANESESDYINRIANIDFLFIDDLGTERVQTQNGDLWLQEKIFDVLNKRYNMKKPTIFTSNYSLPELINERGIMDKTVDRIAEMSNAIFEIKGASYRMKARKTDLPF